MKKTLLIILILILTLLLLIGCGGDEDAENEEDAGEDTEEIIETTLDLESEDGENPEESTEEPTEPTTEEPTEPPTEKPLPPKTGDKVRLTMNGIPAIKTSGSDFLNELNYRDETGEQFYVGSINQWFENALFGAFTLPQYAHFSLGRENGEFAYKIAEGVVITLTLSVDGTEYSFGFGQGRQFITVKTDTGYKLLPEETLEINPAPENPPDEPEETEELTTESESEEIEEEITE